MSATDALADILTQMCNDDDYDMVLTVLQLLSKIRRGGYMTLTDHVSCLIYCANRFADNENGNFFQEFVQYMPDINRITNNNGSFFSVKCKTYYYAYKHTERLLYKLQNHCTMLDVLTLDSFFKQFLLKNNITCDWQLDPLFKSVGAIPDLNNDGLQSLCDTYTVPIRMVSGR